MLDLLFALAALSGAPEATREPEPASPPERCVAVMRDFLQPLGLSHEKLAAFEPRRLQFRIRLTPVAEHLKPDMLRLSLIDGAGGRTVYPANRVGAFDIPMSRFAEGEETRLHIGPDCKGGFAVGAELAVLGPHGMSPDKQGIREAMAEYDALIRQQGFLVRLFAPKLRTLVVRFPVGQTGECTGQAGKKAQPYRVNERFELNVSLKDYFQYDSFSCRAAPEEILLSADR